MDLLHYWWVSWEVCPGVVIVTGDNHLCTGVVSSAVPQSVSQGINSDQLNLERSLKGKHVLSRTTRISELLVKLFQYPPTLGRQPTTCPGHLVLASVDDVADEAVHKLTIFFWYQNRTWFALLFRKRSKLITCKDEVFPALLPNLLVNTMESAGTDLISKNHSLSCDAVFGYTFFLSDWG